MLVAVIRGIMNLLIVDDHSGYRALIRRLIARPGDEVRECASGEAAVELLGGFVPDFITIDLVLPGMNGFAAICAFRRECPTARIVMVSSFYDPACRVAAESLGAETFVGKGDLVRLCSLVAGGAEGLPSAPQGSHTNPPYRTAGAGIAPVPARRGTPLSTNIQQPR
jgi:DNA-binding NarL/FixJ family response regulator